jgi:LEA14-like dessication related protein
MLRVLLALSFLTFLASGCAFFGKTVEKPTAQVRAVTVGSASFTGIDGEVALDIQNPNGFAVPLSAIDWQLSVGDTPAVDGRIELSETIPARGTAPVLAALHIDARDALAVAGELSRGTRTYRIDARLHFSTTLGPITVDVTGTGEL